MSVVRIGISVLGLTVLSWAILAFFSFQATAPSELQAQQIIAGEPFKDDVLARTTQTLDKMPAGRLVEPKRLRSAAILSLRLVESALDRVDAAVLDARMVALRGTLQAGLAANPTDPFLWLTRYWLDNTQNGFTHDNLAALAASYGWGPREGWIAARRERLAFVVYAQLDAATQARVVEEFSAMVDAGLTAAAADNLAGPGWPLRDRLVASLAEVDLASKQALAKTLFTQGIPLAIPGVPDLGDRPWR